MNRGEHLAWAKQRALEYVDAGDHAAALASLASDLTKHPELAGHDAIELGHLEFLGGHLDQPQQLREFIQGLR